MGIDRLGFLGRKSLCVPIIGISEKALELPTERREEKITNKEIEIKFLARRVLPKQFYGISSLL